MKGIISEEIIPPDEICEEGVFRRRVITVLIQGYSMGIVISFPGGPESG
jgi:hypothetical protein